MDESTDLPSMPLWGYLSEIDVDCVGLGKLLDQWFPTCGGTIVNQAVVAIGTVVCNLMTFFIGNQSPGYVDVSGCDR